MADNVELNAGSGGAIIATDDDGVAQHQYVKIEFGADNTQTKVTSSVGLPVNMLDDATRDLGIVTVDGTVTATGPVTDAELRATPVPVSGTVTANPASGTIDTVTTVTAVTDITNTIDSTISGAALTALQKIDNLAHSGSDVALSEHVPISGQFDDVATTTVTENQVAPVRINASRALHVDGSGVTQPVSGTVTATGPLTDTELRATAVPVSAASLPLPSGAATAAAQLPDGHNVTIDNTTGAPANVQIGDGTSQATVRNLAANDALNVAIVDGSGGQITSFGGGTEYTEDVATANPIVGTATLIERDDALTPVTPIEGDWIGLRGTAEGALWTQDFNSDAILADTSNMDTNLGTIAGAVADGQMQVDIVADGAGLATAANQLPDGHNVTIDNGAAGAAVNIQDGGNSITVDGAVTTTKATTDNNHISTNNSTTSLLGISGVYTGTAEDVSSYSAITIMLSADQDSATDGMTFEFCPDNSFAAGNTDVYVFTLTANTKRRFQFPVTAQYFRVKYTNGGTGQGDFDVQTILHKHPVSSSVHRLIDNVSPDRSAQVIKSALIAQSAGSGNFIPVQATSAGNFKIAIEEISDGLDVGAGNAGTETQRVSISTDDVNLSAIKTATETVAGAVATGQMQVDIVADGAGLLTTSAHDAAFGTAGAADAQVRSVQGIASMTPLLVDATGQGDVPITLDGEAVVLGAGSAAIGKLAANSGVDIGDVDILSLPASTNTIEVVGDAAHDAAAAGNPVLIGVESRTTEPTAVGDGDAVRVHATSLGKQVVYPYAIPASTWSYVSTSAVTDAADDVAKAAAGAGIRNYITGIQVMNGHDTVGTAVVIKDGSTVIWQGWAEQTGGGCSAKFDPPLRGTANTAVNVANVTTGSSTFFNLQGFVAAE